MVNAGLPDDKWELPAMIFAPNMAKLGGTHLGSKKVCVGGNNSKVNYLRILIMILALTFYRNASKCWLSLSKRTFDLLSTRSCP